MANRRSTQPAVPNERETTQMETQTPHHADAKAIAALPDLLKALAGALEELDRHEPYSVTDPLIARRRAARAALQKAGVTP